jgi:mono/diheme cytochrome c family protein
MKWTLLGLFVLAFSTSAYAALPGNAAEGKKLHDANCTGCHGSSVYTRKDRKIQSAEALRSRINDCAHGAKKSLTPEEQDHIAKYLNETFYKFE